MSRAVCSVPRGTFSGRRVVSFSGSRRPCTFQVQNHGRVPFADLRVEATSTSDSSGIFVTSGHVCETPALDETVVVERSAPSTRLGKADAVVSVCTHKHCCKRGALGVLRALKEDAARVEGLTIDVRCSTCLGQCKKGPSVHVSLSTGEEVVAVKVESGHDVQQLAAVAMYYD